VVTTQGKIHYGTYDGALVTVHAGDQPSRAAQWGVEGGDLSHSWRVQKPGAGKEIGMGQVALGVPSVLLRGFAGDTFTVEFSPDLKTWKTWVKVSTQNGLAALDPLATGLPLGNGAFRVK